MINFRFHLVSLIAVFLAIGLGVLVGSTVVDQEIVDRLDREISSVSHESNQIKSDNSALKDEVSRLNDFLKKSSAYAVENRLTDVPGRNHHEEGRRSKCSRPRCSTRYAPRRRCSGRTLAQRQVAAEHGQGSERAAVGHEGDGEAAHSRDAALHALVKRLATPAPAAKAGHTAAVRDVVEPLRSAGFLDFTDGKKADLTAFPARKSRVLVLTGSDSHLATTDTMLNLVQSLLDANVPTVLGEVYDPNAAGFMRRPSGARRSSPVRGDPTLAKNTSRPSTTPSSHGRAHRGGIALQQIAEGTVGHYGYGTGANETIPPFPQ